VAATPARPTASLGLITITGHLIAERLQPFCERDELMLDTVDGDSILASLRDLPHGLQRLLEARDSVIDAS
jgi:hypothetical protein